MLSTWGIVEQLSDAKLMKEQHQSDDIGNGTRHMGAASKPRNGQRKHLYTAGASIGGDIDIGRVMTDLLGVEIIRPEESRKEIRQSDRMEVRMETMLDRHIAMGDCLCVIT